MILTITAVALSGLLNINPAIVMNTYNQNKTQKVIEEVVYDDRGDRLDAYFKKWNMPLEGTGAKFVEEADKYDLDWRFIPAIGVKESSGGKHMRNNNPFGWASCAVTFEDFDEAIEVLALNLSGNNPSTARYYKDNSIDDKLWYYNGSVIASYPSEIKYIMTLF